MVAAVFVGLLLSPALNLLIDRLPRGLPLRALPSCRSCGVARPRRALLPVAGWLLAGGRCEHCGARLPRRALVVELALPVAGGLLALREGYGPLTLIQLVLVAYFVAIVAIDLEHRLVLNRMTGPGLLAALALATVGVGPSLPSALAGALTGFLFLWLPTLVIPGVGMGDIKLAAVIGALVGFPTVFLALLLGVLAGGAAAAVLLVTRRAGRHDTFAYAPYLVAGVALVLFGLGAPGVS